MIFFQRIPYLLDFYNHFISNYFWFLIANVDTDFVHHLCRMRIETPRRFGHVKTVEDERIKLAIIAANNQYAGFGPGTANVFRNMLGLPEAKWQEREGQEQQQQYPAHDFKQHTLSDFLG